MRHSFVHFEKTTMNERFVKIVGKKEARSIDFLFGPKVIQKIIRDRVRFCDAIFFFAAVVQLPRI